MQSSNDEFDPTEDMKFNPLSVTQQSSRVNHRQDDLTMNTTINTIYSELMNLKISHAITDRRIQSLAKDVKELSEIIKTIKVSSESKNTTIRR